MPTKEQLLEKPNYLLTKYQQEIFRQVKTYIDENKLTQKDFAKHLGVVSGKPEGVSEAYVSQLLNGNFNFTLKKLIELGIAIGKVPVMNFENVADYWNSQLPKKLPKKDMKLQVSGRKLKRKETGESPYALAG
jgi:transcriptional regulator with XRE-family HTH domain